MARQRQPGRNPYGRRGWAESDAARRRLPPGRSPKAANPVRSADAVRGIVTGACAASGQLGAEREYTSQVERPSGLEPPSRAWKARVMTLIRQARGSSRYALPAGRVHSLRPSTAVLGVGQLAAWQGSLGADTAKWWRGHLRALRQNDAAGAKRADSGWGSVERAAVGAAWRIPIPAQVRCMVVGTLEVEWPPRHNSERAATSGPDTGATAAAASSCAPALGPRS